MWICQKAIPSSTTQPYLASTDWVEFNAPEGPAGAKGETQKQMMQVMHYSDNTEKVNKIFKLMTEDLKMRSSEGVKITFANALWIHEDFEFTSEYQNTIKKYYDGNINTLNFVQDCEKGRQKINKWVEKETNNRITELFPPNSIANDTRLIITNTVYFYGEWLMCFDEADTKQKDFNVSTDTKVKTPFMMLDKKFKYYKDNFVQLIELPYADNTICLMIVLPAEPEKLTTLESRLNSKIFSEWNEKMNKTDVHVEIPKFKMEAIYDLAQVLNTLGMSEAFSQNADFSGISNKTGLAINQIMHKTFIEVNESGTEAAAATGVSMVLTSIPNRAENTFIANHPFLFVIKDNFTGNILFLGRMNNPNN